jgi:hypothetical protein
VARNVLLDHVDHAGRADQVATNDAGVVDEQISILDTQDELVSADCGQNRHGRAPVSTRVANQVGHEQNCIFDDVVAGFLGQ